MPKRRQTVTWMSDGLVDGHINRRHFADDILKCIFLNENILIAIEISLKFVPKGPINNIPALVLIMAWRRPGDKPLSEPRMISLPTHICATRPQWVNKGQTRQTKNQCISVMHYGYNLTGSLRLVIITLRGNELYYETNKMFIYDSWGSQQQISHQNCCVII